MFQFLTNLFQRNHPEDTRVVLGFWEQLPAPIWALAPMADVTDAAFRQVIAKYSRHGEPGGGPDIFWTEFVSVDGLLSPGREVLTRDLAYSENERPIVAQIFGSKPENFEKVASMIAELGFDGIDINMGCPDRSVNKQGAGAALCQTPRLAQDIIRATKRGAGTIPVSVKVRIGWNHDETETWIPALLKTKPAAITIHARTRKDMSLTDPKWSAVKRAVELRDKLSPETKILANGGILTYEQGLEVVTYTGCDGVMLGKAIFGNPWLFSNIPHHDQGGQPVYQHAPGTILTNRLGVFGEDHMYHPTIPEQLTVMLEHTKLFLDLLGDIKNFAVMKKHYKAYVNGFPGAKELRMELMDARTYDEIESITHAFLTAYER